MMTREEKAQFCIDNPHKSPAFQFYPDNWWGSRHIAAMSIEQRGIHASLIFTAWLEENCGIPDNEICLSARIPEDKKPIALEVLSWCWFLYQGFWFCERLLKERIKQINLSEIRVCSGSKGGRPLKSKINREKPIDNQKDSKPKPKITKSEEEKEIEKEKEIRIRSEEFKTEINTFLEYPEELRNEFYEYWTEPNKSKTAMRFEQETTWDLSRRLKRWSKNNRVPSQGKRFGRQDVSMDELRQQAERVKLS